MNRLVIWTIAAALPIAALGQETLVLRDGTTFDGRMTGASESSITFRDNSGQMHRFDVDRVQSIQFMSGDRASSYRNEPGPNNGYPPAPPPPPDARYGNSYPPPDARSADSGYNNSAYSNSGESMVVPAGTQIAVRSNESIDARDATQGTSYSAQVDRDVVDPNGRVIIPRGAEARLVVRRMNDNNLALDLASIRLNGRTYMVDTSGASGRGHEREGVGENKRTGEFVGGGAVLGTLLGAIAGGGKGAAIGAVAGAGAGAGAQVLTRGDQVRVPAESVLTFRLDRPLYLNGGR